MMDFDRIHSQVRRLRTGLAFKFKPAASGRSVSKFDRSKGVVVKSRYFYHKGSKAEPDAASKLKGQGQYIAGDRTPLKDRQLYDERGEITSKESAKEHSNVFIEHRLMISPAGNSSKREDLAVYAMVAIQKAREANPKAEIRASFAIHLDTDQNHSHLLLTSPNRVKLDKSFYDELREELREIRLDLERDRSRGMQHTHTIDQALGRDQVRSQEPELELGR